MAQEPTADLNGTFEVTENEDAEITKSIQASLLVQAPLQVVLETLYEKLKAQSGAISKINKEVDELRGDDGNPLDRLRMLEQRFNAIFGEPGSEASFSPFKQQELVNKVEFLGNTVAQQAEVIRHLQKVKKENTYPRLERLEAALHGVDNLAGRTIAMDTMAEDLAVPIPTLNTSPLGTGQDGSSTFHTTSVATGSPMGPPSTLSTFAPAVAGFAQREPGSYAPTALLDTAASFMNATQSPETAAAADATRKSLATGQQPRTIKALHDGMQELREDNEALRMRMGDILTQYEEFASEHAAQGTDFTARMVALQEAHQSTTEDVGTRLLRLDKITRVVEEVDVRGVHERVHGLVRQFDETDIFVKHLQNKELPLIRDELHEMRHFVKLAASAANGELRDSLLALERDLEVVKKKLNGGLLACIGADAPSVAGMARQQDLLEVSNSVGTKVDRGELQGILKKAVTGALEAAQKELALAAAAAINNAAARAIKSRCLSCDHEVHPVRPESVGPLPSKAGLLPNTDKFPRPATAGAGGLAGYPSGPGLNAAAARQLQMEERRGAGSLPHKPYTADGERRRPATASPTPPVFI